MAGRDKLKSLPNQISRQAVDVEDELLSFGCFVPQGGVNTLLHISIKSADAQRSGAP